jgi:hypothetical protein
MLQQQLVCVCAVRLLVVLYMYSRTGSVNITEHTRVRATIVAVEKQ